MYQNDRHIVLANDQNTAPAIENTIDPISIKYTHFILHGSFFFIYLLKYINIHYF